MDVNVVNSGIDYSAVSSSGRKLAIKSGEGKPADDTSMNPVELFMASLGMCVAAMLRRFCNTHNLECGEIKVKASGDWKPGAPACCAISIEVEVEGEWNERRKEAFHKVAETCPVHESIRQCGPVDIRIL